MKAIRMILVIAMVMVGVMGLFAAESMAAGPYTCTVVQAGPASTLSGHYRIIMTDDAATPAFTNKSFCPAAGYERDMLAIALTAMANGKKVKIWTEGATFLVTIMYLVN